MQKAGREKCRLTGDPAFIAAASFKKRRHSRKTLQVKPGLSGSDDKNRIMRVSWSLADFSVWRNHRFSMWARWNNAMFEVFVVVWLLFLFWTELELCDCLHQGGMSKLFLGLLPPVSPF